MTLDPTVRALADAACRDLGLSPWLVLHRPRLHARIAAFSAMTAQVRADAMRVQGKRPRGRDGRFLRVSSSEATGPGGKGSRAEQEARVPRPASGITLTVPPEYRLEEKP